jgi:outer membrane protein assembly factor BamB
VLKASALTVASIGAGCTAFEPSARTPVSDGTPVSHREATASGAWPQLAHDARNTSYSAGTDGPLSDVEVAWTAAPDEAEFHVPAVTDAVYLAERRDGSAYALDRHDGTVTWRNGSLSGTHWPVAVHEDRLLVVTGGGEDTAALRAFDARDGTQLWARDTGASSGGFLPVAPTVTDEAVFLATDTGVTALEVDTGDRRWATNIAGDLLQPEPDRPMRWTTPAVRGPYVYTFDRNESEGPGRQVFALDRETGARLWSRTLTAPEPWQGFDNHVLASEDRLVVTVSGVINDDTEPDGAGGGTPDRYGGRVFVLNPTSGAVRWTRDVDGTIGVAALGGERLYLPTYNTESDIEQLRAIDLAARERDWGQTFDEIVTAVAATDEAVYANADGLVAVDADDGTQLWTELADQPVGSPVVADGAVYATLVGGGEFEGATIAAVTER